MQVWVAWIGKLYGSFVARRRGVREMSISSVMYGSSSFRLLEYVGLDILSTVHKSDSSSLVMSNRDRRFNHIHVVK